VARLEQWANTKVQYNGSYVIDLESHNVLCEVNNMCTAATTPPLCPVPGNEVEVDTNPATCTTHSPWWCGQIAVRLPGFQSWTCLPSLTNGGFVSVPPRIVLTAPRWSVGTCSITIP
jgi:hypothetical protein